MSQSGRWLTIFFFAEAAAIALAIGVVDRIVLQVFLGLNFAFIASFVIVMDHEARGRGK